MLNSLTCVSHYLIARKSKGPLPSCYNTSIESSFNGKSEYKDVELFRTDEEHPKIASGVNFKQLQLFIQGREVLMTKFRHWR